MSRVLTNSLLVLTVLGLLALPGFAQTKAGNSRSEQVSMSQPADHNSHGSSQQAEQRRVTAEGEGWVLHTSRAINPGGGGEGGAGR